MHQKPRGQEIQLVFFVDSDYADDRISSRSQTGIILYCNSSPILRYSKRHNNANI